jgi:cell division ATPase FtsA
MDVLKKVKNLINFTKNSPYFYTLDIGSDSIKVQLFEIHKEEFKLKLIDSVKIAQDLDVYKNGKILNEEKILSSLNEAIHRLVEKNSIKVKNVVCCISAPNSRTIMTTLKVNRQSKQPISSVETDEITHKLLENAYSSLSNVLYEESLTENANLEMIDLQPVYITCDDRVVLDLEGEEASEVEMCFSISFADSEYISHISRILNKTGLNIISFVPSSVAILNALKKGKKEKLDGVILNIGASSTEAIVCFGGGIFLNKSIPMGGSDITKEISLKLKRPYLDAEKIKRLYSMGKLNPKDSSTVLNIINGVLTFWHAGIEELFKHFSGVKTFAPDFYLVGGGSDLPDVKEQLFEEPWTKSIPFKSSPEFKKIDLSKLKELERSEELRSSEDLLPLLCAYYYFLIKGVKNNE